MVCPSISIKEELPMTMQVGMLATDGIVLAGDTWSHSETTVRSGYSSSKIRINDTAQIAVTCARDMVLASHVAEAIMSGVQGKDWQNCERFIRDAACEAAGERDIECIVAFAGNLPALYQFQYVKGEKYCSRIIDCIHAGDVTNAAVFWTMRYYRHLPVDRLSRLAAHLIVTSAKLNTATIKGLEVVFCKASGFQRLPVKQTLALQTTARELDERIGELILG